MTTIVTKDPFWGTCCTGSIQNIEGVSGVQHHTVTRLGFFQQACPVKISAFFHTSLNKWPLPDNNFVNLIVCKLKGFINQWFIFDDTGYLNPCAGGKQHFRFSIIYSNCQFLSGKSAKNHRMYCPKSCASQHRKDNLRDHRHINNDPVALFNALCPQ